MATEPNSRETEYNPGDNLRLVSAEELKSLRVQAGFFGGRDKRAQHVLGRLLFFGERGVQKNVEEGLKFLFKSAAQKDLWAQYDLGSILFKAKQYEKAVPFLVGAAEQEHEMARYTLALCYFHGHGVKQDQDAAVRQMRALATNPGSSQGLDLPEYWEAKEKAQQFLDQMKNSNVPPAQDPGPEQALN